MFWTLLAGPVAVALYQTSMANSAFQAAWAVSNPGKPAWSITNSQNLLNDVLIPIGVGYAGSYVIARFSGVGPMLASLAGATAAYTYYSKIAMKVDPTLQNAEAAAENDWDSVSAKIGADL